MSKHSTAFSSLFITKRKVECLNHSRKKKRALHRNWVLKKLYEISWPLVCIAHNGKKRTVRLRSFIPRFICIRQFVRRCMSLPLQWMDHSLYSLICHFIRFSLTHRRLDFQWLKSPMKQYTKGYQSSDLDLRWVLVLLGSLHCHLNFGEQIVAVSSF